MTTIVERIDLCRKYGERIEEAFMLHDRSTLEAMKERHEGELTQLAALGCEILCFWLRTELRYGLLVAQHSKAQRVSVPLAMHRWRWLQYATGRVDEILGAI